MGRYSKKPCAYCGAVTGANTGDHVLPTALYPTTTDPRVQRAKVPACWQCNNSFSDDETHFRNVITMCGPEPSGGRKEIWEEIVRSFEPPPHGEPDGERRFNDVTQCIQHLGTWADGTPKLWVYPEHDQRVLRIMRKIVRGLCVHKGWLPWVPDEIVIVRKKQYVVAPGFDDYFEAVYHVPKVLDVKAHLFKPELYHEAYSFHSWWQLIFFDSASFTGHIRANSPLRE
jgi:hypothetical protein